MEFNDPFSVASRGITRLGALIAVTFVALILILGAVPAQADTTPTTTNQAAYITSVVKTVKDAHLNAYVDPDLNPAQAVLTIDQAQALNTKIQTSGHPIYIVDLNVWELTLSGISNATPQGEAERNQGLIDVSNQFKYAFGGDGIFVIFAGFEQGFRTDPSNPSQPPAVIPMQGMPVDVSTNAVSIFGSVWYGSAPSTSNDLNQGYRLDQFVGKMIDPGTNPVVVRDTPEYHAWIGTGGSTAVQAPSPATTRPTSPFTGPQDAYPQAPSSANPVVATLIILGIFLLLVAWPLRAAFRAWQRGNLRKAEEAFARGETVKIGGVTLTPPADPTKDDDSV